MPASTETSAASVSLSPRGMSGEKVEERGMLDKVALLAMALQTILQISTPMQESMEDTAGTAGHEPYRAAWCSTKPCNQRPN